MLFQLWRKGAVAYCRSGTVPVASTSVQEKVSDWPVALIVASTEMFLASLGVSSYCSSINRKPGSAG